MATRTKEDKKFKKKTVKYKSEPVKEWSEDDNDWVILPKWAHQQVVCSHTKRYHNCLYLLAGLGSCARDLMDFITEEMDSNNVICTNEYFRGKFIKFIQDIKKEKGEVTLSYGHSTVKRALTVLFDKNLIRPMRRGYSMVNPKYFFRNDDSKRLDKIKLQLEFESGYNTKLELMQKELGIKKVVE